MSMVTAGGYKVGDEHPSIMRRSANVRHIRPGDQVRVAGLGPGWLLVEDLQGLEILVVRAPSGVPLRVGRATISEVIARGGQP